MEDKVRIMQGNTCLGSPSENLRDWEPCKDEVLKEKSQNVSTKSLIKIHTAKYVSLFLP